MESQPPLAPRNTELSRVLDQNIKALLQRRRREDAARPLRHRIAARITTFSGSMAFVYLHLALFGFWIVANLPFVPFPKFDPSYVVLAMFASVEAIFLSTFVLITQNRMAELADKRDDLNLQISLLAEHEVTRLVELVSQIGQKLGIDEATNPELKDLMRDVDPETVLDSIGKAAAAAEKPDAAS
ncbi:MAG TPA: DUF1003 domain-containing protein [Chthoniobacteraceae bacterium]